jgi:tetratricopeptide (TPR) repeat protein
MAVGRRGGTSDERQTCAIAGGTVMLSHREDPLTVCNEHAFTRAAAGVAWALVVGGVVSACGSATPSAQSAQSTPPPVSASTAADAGAGSAVTPSTSPVVGVPAGPSGAAGDLTGDAKVSYDRGFQAWMGGDLKGARAAFTDAASKAPGSPSPRYSLGCVLERLGDTQGASDAYRAAYGASSKYDPAVGAYALLLAGTGRGPDAEQFLAQKRAANPDSSALLIFLAEVKSIEGDSPGCQQLAQQALQVQPDAKEAMVVIARDYYRAHRWDLARYALQAILDGADDGSIPPRDKGNPEALLLRALIERDTGERKQAIADFEQAASRRPDLFEAYVNLGEMKLEAGNAVEAQSPLEKAVSYAPNVGIAHLDLGDCYRLLGRPADAKRELDAALNIDSTLAGAHYDLGLLYLFSSSVPGVSGQDDQLTRAIRELESYKSMRGAKAPKGQGDDVDELLNTAKRKQSELQLKNQASAAPASTAPPAGSNPVKKSDAPTKSR